MRVAASFVLLLLCLAPCVRAQGGLTRYVDPFVGTGGHGHTFPGATRPFGMVQLSPDTRLSGWDGCSGYHYSDSIVYGFSHTHLSGTGISDYGDVLLMPTAGEVLLDALPEGDTRRGYASRFGHADERAAPGYYSVKLYDENIFVELTATDRVGLHRYTYPAGTREANVILDLAHRDKVLDSELKVVSPTRVEGFRRSDAWARDQLVYFVAEFSRPFMSQVIPLDDRLTADASGARGTSIKSYFSFEANDAEPLLVKVALSPVSVEGARKNLAAELPHWDFERVKAEADAAWEKELKKIEASGGTDAQLTNFYTALYHAMLAPNLFMDVDGAYRGLDKKNHRAEGFTKYTVFSLWDTFRAAHPLYTIIDRRRTRDFVNTFLKHYEHGGRLPVWELAANETDTMIGYHAASVIADAAAKDVGGFDLGKAFAAMKHSATLKHFGLASYVERGYISSEDEPESVSKTLEYAYDDWCVAAVARMLERRDDYQLFARRAQHYKNLYDPSTGFMRARRNGDWVEPFDPREVNFAFTEANSWQYTFFAPHDITGLIKLMGGERAFERKLDALFAADSRTTGREQADITGLVGQYAHGNEPSHHMAYLYNFVGRPWKTQARVRQLMDDFYRPTPDGLIGNEDCGQMSAWYVFSAAGFYPVTPGTPTYVIGTPLFRETRFNLEDGRAFVVRAPSVSARNRYVQSATLDGQPYTKSYLTHDRVMRGGTLTLRMGPRPNKTWGARREDAPSTSIEAEPLVPVPVLRSAGATFRDALTVTARTTTHGLLVRYTTDGTEPDARSTLYGSPLVIRQPTTVKAAAFDARGGRSHTVTARYHRVPHDWRIETRSKYAPQYSAGGPLALIDGLRGGRDFRTGAWQGFQGQNFEATIDLGKLTNVSRLGAGFLQDVRSWIWMPTRVEFELSADGATFDKAAAVTSDVSDRDETVSAKDFTRDIAPRRARFVRVRAYNYGAVPAWHPGAGGQAWIFVDEITVD